MQPLCASIFAKISEQQERTEHLLALIPADHLDWAPPIAGAWPFGQLLGHWLDCLAGVCAVLHAAHPDLLAHFAELRKLPVNGNCTRAEALAGMSIYRRHIAEGFAALTDDDLARKLPTVFVAEGESVLTLLLGNLEHLVNHKHQLFTGLKLAGVPAGTADLYAIRG